MTPTAAWAELQRLISAHVDPRHQADLLGAVVNLVAAERSEVDRTWVLINEARRRNEAGR
jgi:hypothetical protein